MLLCPQQAGDFRTTEAVNSPSDRTGSGGMPDHSQVALIGADRDLFDCRAGKMAAAKQTRVASAKELNSVGPTAGHQKRQPWCYAGAGTQTVGPRIQHPTGKKRDP